MMTLSCLCGAVRVLIASRPDFVNACNCTLCTKSGARWAYYHPDQVDVSGTTRQFHRTDKADASAGIHFCETCGSTTHFTLTANAIARFGNTLIGVNVRLADEEDLHGIELRFPDGRAWSGVGEFGYVRSAVVIDTGENRPAD